MAEAVKTTGSDVAVIPAEGISVAENSPQTAHQPSRASTKMQKLERRRSALEKVVYEHRGLELDKIG